MLAILVEALLFGTIAHNQIQSQMSLAEKYYEEGEYDAAYEIYMDLYERLGDYQDIVSRIGDIEYARLRQ